MDNRLIRKLSENWSLKDLDTCCAEIVIYLQVQKLYTNAMWMLDQIVNVRSKGTSEERTHCNVTKHEYYICLLQKVVIYVRRNLN